MPTVAEEWRRYMASLTPEQRELQKKAVELDKLGQKTRDPVERAKIRAEHHAVVDRLIILAFPPDGRTTSLTGHDHHKRREVKEDAESQGAEGI